MSNFKIIGEIGEALRRIILRVPWTDLDFIPTEENIVFQSPKEVTGENQISVFLYRIMKNSFLMNQEAFQADHRKQVDQKYQNQPLVLDLYYLITPYVSDKSQEKYILGKILQIFHDHSYLEDADFSEPYAGTTFRPQITFESLTLDDLSKLWTSFHDAPLRLSVCYQVSPVRIDSTRTEEFQRVVVKEMDHYQMVRTREAA